MSLPKRGRAIEEATDEKAKTGRGCKSANERMGVKHANARPLGQTAARAFRVRACIRARAHAWRTCVPASVNVRACSHACLCTLMQARSRARTHAHGHTHARMHGRTPKHGAARTHAHAFVARSCVSRACVKMCAHAWRTCVCVCVCMCVCVCDSVRARLHAPCVRACIRSGAHAWRTCGLCL